MATVLEIKEQFVFPNINCEDVHPDILALIDTQCIPKTLLQKEINIAIKASFGFGDVNGCVIFKKY